MSKKPSYFISNRADRESLVSELLRDMHKDKPFFVVWVAENALGDTNFTIPKNNVEMARVLMILEGRPVSTKCLEWWRKWAQNRKVKDFKMDFVESDSSEEVICKLLQKHCADWLRPPQSKEGTKICIREWVNLPNDTRKHDPALLTMMFGSMGELLSRMDLIAKRFSGACSIAEQARNDYLEQTKKQLNW